MDVPLLHRSSRWFVAVILVLSALPYGFLDAQGRDSSSSKDSFEIASIGFEGNNTFDNGLLASLIQSKESPGWFTKFLYNTISRKLGSPAELYDPVVLEADVRRLEQFYRDKGFFEARITTNAPVDTSDRTVDLTFLIEENQRSLIDSVRYVGIDSLPEDVRAKVYLNSFIEPSDPYDQDVIEREILRILNVLYDNGYPQAHFVQEHSIARRSLRTNRFTLLFPFYAGPRYRFGDITVRIEGRERPDIRDDMLLRFLNYEPSEIYSQNKRLVSERTLYRLGLFERARIEVSIPSEEDSSKAIPTSVVVLPKDKHELNPEVAILEENNAFNVGLGMGYTNLNFFGQARTFTTALRFRVQEIGSINFLRVFGRTGLNDTTVVGGAELNFQLAQPYVFSRNFSGLWSFSLIADKQKSFVLTTIRNRFGFRYELEPTTSGFMDWNLERIKLDALEGASASEFIRQRPEEQRPQFNSILSLTLQRDRTNDIFSPSQGYSWAVGVEEAGILPALGEQLGSNLPFSQFYKFTLFGRYFTDLTHDRYTIIATKAKFGFAHKYFVRSRAEAKNRDLPVPLNRRFFAGGSGSVRGWRTRELGAVSDPQLGGNALFELSAEARINFTRGLGRIWVVDFDNVGGILFADAGNIWTDVQRMRLSETALSVGFGLRYDAIFGPFRVDLGFQLYDPRNQQWIFQRKALREASTLHFGIGQAF